MMPPLLQIFLVALVAYIAATIRMTQITAPYGGLEMMPDLRFGFTADSLRERRENSWGEQGCQAYVKAATLDLFPYMEAYTVALWCLATVSTRNNSTRTKNLARILATLPVCFDVVETLILRQTCLSDISDEVVAIASIANQFKWVFFVGFFAIYLPLWLVNSCVVDDTKAD
mmetsp:Transcript_35749/g.86340  ORF Transcript_35749/g.86340 Transcript_35749/m.86340 type:complete len:172 (+) Transcript_35749:174-689(+)|eukprot:CAMPEP_0113441128 /NCGR_PEP_ID=MMETSP0014_2-20120614/916_1 /TAXON_ID=2857 /ORGANISM="Nitzschia sp." /LENGTH=171 /DNA_ID=CAMNT_0000331949 /DNA_START=113 /DNA_END=628 /DNA_ORIENTATION=- /assembly_acc=CAM_ASM_000159